MIDRVTSTKKTNAEDSVSQDICKQIIWLRLGEKGDGSRPLGWKKIESKLKITSDTLKKARRSPYYFHYALDVCNNIGVVRLQAISARQQKSLPEVLDKCFRMEMYLIDSIVGVIDENPLPMREKTDGLPTDAEIEYLAQEADKLVVIHDKEGQTGFELVETINLSRRHIKWLLDQGYEYRSDKILLRASSMTRSVSARSKLKTKEDYRREALDQKQQHHSEETA